MAPPLDAEADARLRLEIANRHGNPNIGPDYEYDPTRINFIGAHFTLPLPVCNRHRGEILQRQAEKTKALQELNQVEQQVRQDVETALARWHAALAWEAMFRSEILPEIQTDVARAEHLAAELKDNTDSAAELTELRIHPASTPGVFELLEVTLLVPPTED